MKALIAFSFVVASLIFGCAGTAGESGNSAEVSNYLDKFEVREVKSLQFDSKNLPSPVKSPFDEKEVHPSGKIDLGDGRTIAIVTYIESEEPFGEVWAELIKGGQRTDRILVAASDFDSEAKSEFALPEITVFAEYATEMDEGGSSQIDTTFYRIDGGKFVKVE